MSIIQQTNVEGDVTVGRNVVNGGNATTRGNSVVDGNLRVNGWLSAKNILDACKGLFENPITLNKTFPHPKDGWYAFVGNTLPAPVYEAINGEWKATGETGGETIVDLEKLNRFEEKLDGFLEFIVDGWFDTNGYKYTRISTQVAFDWRAAGGGTIESVTPDTDTTGKILLSGTAILSLSETQPSHIAIDDICYGLFHNTTDESRNATEDFDDGIGNFQFKNLCITYFRITEIITTDNGNIKFKYVLRNDENWSAVNHPSAGTVFVCYGNFSNITRQSSKYSCTEYERFMTGVTTWQYTAANMAAQFGDLTNLTVFGINLPGQYAYINNFYVNDIANAPVRMEHSSDKGEVLDFGEISTFTFTLKKAWMDVTNTAAIWEVKRESGDAANDEIWNNSQKARSFSGIITIAFTKEVNDLGTSDLITSTLFTFTAKGDDGVPIAKEQITM